MIGASSTARKHTRVADVDQLVEVDVVESGKRVVRYVLELDSSAIVSCARNGRAHRHHEAIIER